MTSGEKQLLIALAKALAHLSTCEPCKADLLSCAVAAEDELKRRSQEVVL